MFSTFNATGSVLVCGSKAIIPPTLASYYATAYSSYQTPNYNATTKIWNDSSPNLRHIAFSVGAPTIVSSVGVNGTSNTFNVVDSIGDAKFNFGNVTMTNFTFFAVSRHKSTAGNSVFANTALTGNLTGYWGAWSGVRQAVSSFIDTVDHYSTNFFELTDSNTVFRTNGTTKGSQTNSLLASFCIYNGGAVKPWQIAEMILFNSTLSATDITTIEGLLRTKYGITTL